MHQLPIEDRDIPLIPFSEWADYEDEISQVFARFITEVIRNEKEDVSGMCDREAK